jgi:hypothetical protein
MIREAIEKVVKGGWTIGQGVLPLTAPAGISNLAGMDVSTR